MGNFGLLLICHALAGAVWLAWIIYYEVPLNARMIADNKAADNLHGGFHRRRTNVRALVAGGLVLAANLPYMLSWRAYAVSCGGLLVLLATIFIRTFNPLLNVARGLVCVPRFYVSQSPTASRFDRLLAQWPLQTVLNWALFGGLGLYAVLMAAGWYFADL